LKDIFQSHHIVQAFSLAVSFMVCMMGVVVLEHHGYYMMIQITMVFKSLGKIFGTSPCCEVELPIWKSAQIMKK
jgi:hypothetical protein